MDLRSEINKRAKINRKMIPILLAKGLTHTQIARVLGVSRQRIGYLIHKQGIKVKGDVEMIKDKKGGGNVEEND
jgi:DNA-directed RNA polymerase specialized sigma subunit